MLDITKLSTYDTVARLDPLSFDVAASELPGVNQEQDRTTLIEIYDTTLYNANQALDENIDPENAVAALRDIDFIAGSLVRAGAIELIQADYSQRVLKHLGFIANTVPRGTVYTYASCNPSDARRRTFTGLDEERTFIHSVTMGIKSLDVAMNELSMPSLEGLERASGALRTLLDSLLVVKHAVKPEFFTHQMRPFFEGFAVDGVSYAGPGGAQMQVIAIDQMLWGADCNDVDYKTYYEDNVRYLTAEHRAAIADFHQLTDGKSIISLINDGSISGGAAESCIETLKMLKKFRYPHRKVARDNFALRSRDAVGSGQYAPNILDKLIMLNEQAIEELKDA